MNGKIGTTRRTGVTTTATIIIAGIIAGITVNIIVMGIINMPTS
ncbi:MAG TPA: hypothetical protein VJ749_00040 [Pyrinomonadaceae bacterium]|nr:hypothetical protein [Pyrinomonadaceae bacterium]